METQRVGEQFQAVLETTGEILDQIREGGKLVSELQSQVAQLRKDTDQLLKLIRDGNGTPSLLARVANLESKADLDKQHVAGRWALIVAIASGLIVLASSALSLLPK